MYQGLKKENENLNEVNNDLKNKINLKDDYLKLFKEMIAALLNELQHALGREAFIYSYLYYVSSHFFALVFLNNVLGSLFYLQSEKCP